MFYHTQQSLSKTINHLSCIEGHIGEIMNIVNYQFNYEFNGDLTQPVILFLHGFMGNCHEFDEAIKLLSKDFSILTVDLPGHGQTKVLGDNECYKMENTASLLIQLINYLGIQNCFLVGYSMGGRLALYLTLNFPQYFPKVVLESASPGLSTEVSRLERKKRDEGIARKLAQSTEIIEYRNFLLNWYNQPIFGDIKNHPEFYRMIEMRLQNNPAELAKSLEFMGTGCQPSLWAKLKYNNTPLLLLAGEYDEKFIEINQEMVGISSKCQLRIISSAGHNIHFENTEEFLRNIKEFFRQ